MARASGSPRTIDDNGSLKLAVEGGLPSCVGQWLFGALLLAGFSNKNLGILGALGSVFTFIATVTIIPFMPDGWAPSAGGSAAMVGNVAFLMEDVVLLAVSIGRLKQGLAKISPAAETKATPVCRDCADEKCADGRDSMPPHISGGIYVGKRVK